jgi:hypothetical protein
MMNFEHRRFCGIPVQIDGHIIEMCKNVAEGEVTAVMHDGNPINVPVCEQHLAEIRRMNEVEEIDLPN